MMKALTLLSLQLYFGLDYFSCFQLHTTLRVEIVMALK